MRILIQKKKKKLTTENLLFTRNQIFMWEWFQEWLTCFCSKGLWLGLTSPGLKESRTLNSAYHPQTNGQTEVVNHSLEDFLQSMVGNHLKVLKSEVVLSWICLQPFYESEHKFRRFTKLLFSFCKILLPSIRQMQMRSCPSVGFEEGDFVWTMLTKDRL